MDDLIVQSHRGPYRVRFGQAFASLDSGLADGEHLIIDAKVAKLYEDSLAQALRGPSVLYIDATEDNKSIERFPPYLKHLIERGIRRNHSLVAVGGGVVQDISAFVAATLLRGVPWRFYPTTLLAQADSCIGSKSSINVGPYKNQLGTFTPPDEVVISADVLATLQESEIRSGIGEMIKVHIISGWTDTRAISADYRRIIRDRNAMIHYIRRSLEIKKAKVEADEFDRNERLVMNFGHSFGHAIESATNYQVPHGIAVTIGMDMAIHVSHRLGLAKRDVCDELHALLADNYAGFDRVPVPRANFFAAIGKDKKNTDNDISLILLEAPGRVFKHALPMDDHFRSMCVEYFADLQGKKNNTQKTGQIAEL